MKNISVKDVHSLYIWEQSGICITKLKKEYNDEEAGDIKIPWSPFTKYSIPNIICTRERALDADTIRAIYNLPYILTKDKKEKDCRFNFAKDMFILSFCLMGMNSADLFLCDTISESKGTLTITYKQGKKLQQEGLIKQK